MTQAYDALTAEMAATGEISERAQAGKGDERQAHAGIYHDPACRSRSCLGPFENAWRDCPESVGFRAVEFRRLVPRRVGIAIRHPGECSVHARMPAFQGLSTELENEAFRGEYSARLPAILQSRMSSRTMSGSWSILHAHAQLFGSFGLRDGSCRPIIILQVVGSDVQLHDQAPHSRYPDAIMHQPDPVSAAGSWHPVIRPLSYH